ncbi:hypothetical protein CC757_18455 [Salmonella enterica subsp. enterica serovar Newport]|uniref:Uncharacterized protein n=1 Tax=Salmonella newport TaxID=108619 RepID=A0A636ILH4_SALNE|nr:hypothetical protein [Salmonella enterica subsp. enterica serovar Newport]
MHTTRNGKSARDELPFRPLKWREFITATVQAAHPFTDAASVMWMLRHGWKEAARSAASFSAAGVCSVLRKHRFTYPATPVPLLNFRPD